MRAELHVFASGHGDEEFWYSNVPDQLANITGAPGGGSYREIEIFLDGHPAGSAYPFPTIYSGGVNPLLWRPLAGTHSFNIPPLIYDISPFLPLLNDGRSHEMTAKVRHCSNPGVWYLDPVLLVWSDPDDPRPKTGRLARIEREAPSVSQEIARPSKSRYNITTGGASSFVIEGHQWVAPEEGGDGDGAPPAVTRYVVEGRLQSTNRNSVATSGSLPSVTSGDLSYTIVRTVHEPKQPQRVVQFHHERRRLSIDDSQGEATSSKGETTTTLPAISQLVQLVKRLSERKRSFLPWQEQRQVAGTEEVTAEQEEEEGGGSVGGRVHTSTFHYPYRVVDSQATDAVSATFLLQGEVDLAARRREEWSVLPSTSTSTSSFRSMKSSHRSKAAISGKATAISDSPIVLEWGSRLAASAAYNRSTGPNRTVHLERSTSSANFSSVNICFQQSLSAHDGAIVHARFEDGCPGSALRSMLCRGFDGCAAARRGINVDPMSEPAQRQQQLKDPQHAHLKEESSVPYHGHLLPFRGRRGSMRF